jgi:hypothetical protein
MSDIARAQQALAESYAGGAAGVFMSGLVWLATGLAEHLHDVPFAFLVLFFGGMLIQPAAMLLPRLLLGVAPLEKGNPVARLGLEATFMLFAGLLIGYVLLTAQPQLALPAVALIVGARYFLFRTLYGEPLYWLLGGAIAAVAGAALLGLPMAGRWLLYAVGLIEIGFAVALYLRWAARRGAQRS